MRNSVDRYKDLAKGCGVEVKLKERSTPYRCEAIHQHRIPPCAGPCMVCPWCQTPSPPEQFRQCDSIEVLDAERRQEKKKVVAELEALKSLARNPSFGVSGSNPCDQRPAPAGRLAATASKILM